MTQQIVLQETNGKPLIEVKENGPTFMQLLQLAIQDKAAIDVIERLAALREKEMAQRSLIDFNQALSRVQKEIKRIAPDMEASNRKWASYAAIDRDIRPIYSLEGFSLSFSHIECPKPDHIRVSCRLALGAHVERPWVDMPVDGKGPQGKDVLNKTDATKAADSNAKRYLVKDIFNIAIGQDEEESNMDRDELTERLEYFSKLMTYQEIQNHFSKSYGEACSAGDEKAQQALGDARKRRLRELKLL